MRLPLYYARFALVYLWLIATSMIVLCGFVPFRWRDPSLGRVFGRILWWGASRILNLRITVENQARLYTNQPCIYVANHQSNLDIFTYGSLYPYRTVVIGKKELKWIPVFGILYVATANIAINRQNRIKAIAGLEEAKEAMRERGLSIWIFPEGTRNHGSAEMLPFKKGAFHLAIAAQVPIVPLAHQHVRTYFDPTRHRVGDAEIQIRVLDPIPTTGLTPADIPKLMTEVRTKLAQALSSLPGHPVPRPQ